MNDTRSAMTMLRSFSSYLTKQQYRTIKGQILSGNIEAAMKGLDGLLKRKGM